MTAADRPEAERWPWPAPAADTAADHLVAGTRLPDVTLPATSGPPVRLGTLPGRVVLFIFPWAGRPGHPNPSEWDTIPGAHGSTPELQGIARLRSEFTARGAAVLAVSGQRAEDQAEIATRLVLPFPLLSDAAGAFRDALRLPTFTTGGNIYLKRLTLVARDGAIERVFYPVHPPHTHAEHVLAVLETGMA